MLVRIEIRRKVGFPDPKIQGIKQQLHALGLKGLEQIWPCQTYFLQGESLEQQEVQRITEALLCDPIIHDVEIYDLASSSDKRLPLSVENTYLVDVSWRSGVTDSVAENLVHVAHCLGITQLENAATGQAYTLFGNMKVEAIVEVIEKLLVNSVVQRYQMNAWLLPAFLDKQIPTPPVETILINTAEDSDLEQISKNRRLALDLNEMRAVRTYYQKQNREATDLELEMLAQTWSEHCVHKTFCASINFRSQDLPTKQINSLLKTYIQSVTRKLNHNWVCSAFVDNAGIVAFTSEWDIAFKVETHNHPSALEPFGGANTGVGGVIRDVIGVSARPIATTDVLCFGPLDTSTRNVPKGVLPPSRIADGVISGIEDYGNKMGLPTLSGAILYDKGYIANPLVFCGCVGILPHGAHPTSPKPDDYVVVLGGRTGRDGLRGATFSSMTMDKQTAEVAGSVVQIGHPICEKQVLEVIVQARDQKLYTAITDCGAGGLSSAIGEMAEDLGAEIYLDKVLLKYAGLAPWEMWLSEAQERMVLAVPPSNWLTLKKICEQSEVEVIHLGRFSKDKQLRVWFSGKLVGDLAMDFLHHGMPQMHLEAEWQAPKESVFHVPDDINFSEVLLQALAHPDVRSKEEVIRRYDHEVQGSTVVKPLVGKHNHGPSDATVICPVDMLLERPEAASQLLPGIALGIGINPHYGRLDPYAMAGAVIDEAIRNVVSVGANPDRISLLDNFCWGSPKRRDCLGALVRCTQGCYDAALAFRTPFISGKDSLNNEYWGEDDNQHAIPGTLLISALGHIDNIQQTMTMDFKTAGDVIYVLGFTYAELGGSLYARLHGQIGDHVPKLNAWAYDLAKALHKVNQAGLLKSCHDCSEGGVAVALTEKAIAGSCGFQVDLTLLPQTKKIERIDTLAFSESLSRYVITVHPKDVYAFEKELKTQLCDVASPLLFAPIGKVSANSTLCFRTGDEIWMELELSKVEIQYRGHV